MNLFHTDTFVLPLPPGYRFPMAKYSLLRECLLAGGDFHEPVAASDKELCRAHCPDCVRRVVAGPAETFARGEPELVIYLAGAHPYAGDRLGRLAPSFAGLAERDRHVLAACRTRGTPVALAMAGGYAEPIEDTVSIHAATIRCAQRIFG